MLPNGVSLGRMQGPLAALASISPHFTGAVRVSGPNGTGFLLVQGGNPYAAAFEDTDKNLLLILRQSRGHSTVIGANGHTNEI